MSGREHFIDVDALLVGGGVAGCFAAKELASRGHSVLVTDKTPIKRSGNAGAGIDHWLTTSPLVADQTDDPDLFHEMEQAAAAGFLSGLQDIHDPGLIGLDTAHQEGLDLLNEIEALGIRIRDDRGRLHLVKRSGGTAIWIQGGDFKLKIAGAAVAAGAKAAEHVMVTDLITMPAGEGARVGSGPAGGSRGAAGFDGGPARRVVGATGFNIRTGAFYVFRAKAVLIATGRTARLHHPFLDGSNPDTAFDAVLYPFNTGDGQMMAYRAGAELIHMEFVTLTVTTRDHGTAGISGFLSAGCVLKNALGDEFVRRYEPLNGEAAARQRVSRACLTEIEEGRGPVYLDTTVLGEQDIRDIYTAWDNELPLMPRFLSLKGLEPGRDMVEAAPSIACAFGQVVADRNGSATVAGLFTAGDCAGLPWQGAAGAALVGKRAGREMSAYIETACRGRGAAPELPGDEVDRLRDDVSSVLRARQKGDLHWQELAAELRQVTAAYFGIRRNAAGMAAGRARLERLWELTPRMAAADAHELMRTHETRNLIRYARVMAQAAIERKESRCGNGQWHLRSDFPETADEEYSFIVVTRSEADADGSGGAAALTRREPSIGVGQLRILGEGMRRMREERMAARAG